jgi:hypothetical protein
MRALRLVRQGIAQRQERSLKRLLWICGLLTSASAVAAASSWSVYVNDRYGTSADTPAGWVEQPAPDNDDGRVFKRRDGRATLIVNGGFVSDDTPAAAIESRAQPEEGERVTLSKKGARSLTVSGFKGDQIFYRHMILTCSDQVWNNVDLTYPAAEKAAFDPIVAHVAASLRGNAPPGMTCP